MWSRTGLCRGGGAALVALWAGSAAAVINAIQSVTPSSAQQGTNGVLVRFSLASTPPPPPTNVLVRSVLLGSQTGTFVGTRTNQYLVYATFNIPYNAATGTLPATILYGGNAVTSYLANAFTVTAAPLSAQFTAWPTNGVVPLAASFLDASTGSVTNRLWDFGDGGTSSAADPTHTYTVAGSYAVSLTVWDKSASNVLRRSACVVVSASPTNGAYAVVDTGQTTFYSDKAAPIAIPAKGGAFYGQDAQYSGRLPSYRDNGDGTVSDLNTGLMWVKARGSKIAWFDAFAAATACRTGGYSDWRMPTIKELYSLIQFSGANGTSMTNTAGYSPFIATNVFEFAYGSGLGSERVIDCQDWSATPYVSTTMDGDATVFGVNFADGRIKGYPRDVPGGGATGQVLYARFVRGNAGYGVNKFVNNGDGTITDKATWLMWARNDSGVGLDWSNALAWVEEKNAAKYLGYGDWRLPNAKEMQTLVDYTRSPDTTGTAAADPVFTCTPITNEANQLDYPFYYTGTTLVTGTANQGVYVCFGRALGYMNGAWMDVHGAGAQRSDPKSGSLSSYTFAVNGYYSANAPQGDAVRIANFVRLVRDVPATNAWRFAFVGDTHTPLSGIPAEIAASAFADDARFLIVAGDLAESGAGASSSTLQSQLAQWRSAMSAASANGVGLYVIRGNHEADVSGGLATWGDFFSGSAAMPTNGPSGEVGLTYSFAYANALFVGLDDYAQAHRVNQPWLNAQLVANAQSHLFVFGHEPAFKAFHTDCLDDYPDERDAFWKSLSAAGARVYLCGHDHLFNVARIDDGDGDPSDDLYQYIVGTGGSTNWPPQRYQYTGSNGMYTPVNVASVSNSYGYLLVEVSGPAASDRGVTLTWKQRTYDAQTASYLYVATGSARSYTAPAVGADSVGDGVPNLWRWQYFGGDGSTTNAASAAAADGDGDGATTLQEYLADTDPTNAASRLRMTGLRVSGGDAEVAWSGGSRAWQCLESATDLRAGLWRPLFTNAPPTAVSNALLHVKGAHDTNRVYRIRAWR